MKQVYNVKKITQSKSNYLLYKNEMLGECITKGSP